MDGEFSSAADKDPQAHAMLMAGGTDVLPNMKHRVFTPQVVVGLRGVAALRGIAYDPKHGLRLGAGVCLSELAASPIIRARYPALARAAEVISTPQLRQMGTLGGNLCLDTRCNYYNQSEFWRKARDYCLKRGSEICRVAPNGTGCYAVSSCDTAPVLIALGATARIASRAGDRILPIADLYHDDGIHPVRLHDGDVLTDSTSHPRRATGAPPTRSTACAAPSTSPSPASPPSPASMAPSAPTCGSCCKASPPAHCPCRKPRRCCAASPGPPICSMPPPSWATAAHPMDNTAGTIALRRRIVRAYIRRALDALIAPSVIH